MSSPLHLSADASPLRNRRPDVVVFVNGLPLGVIELKNAADENATLKGAFNQLQTYKHEILSLFSTNELLIISDGLEARVGTLTADWERSMSWRTIDDETIALKSALELAVPIKGMFGREWLLDRIRYFIVFEANGARLVKKLAGYHQYHVVNKAVARTVQAVGRQGDGRAGVIRHTQGSGKSLTMTFYAGKIIRHPTLVVLSQNQRVAETAGEPPAFNRRRACTAHWERGSHAVQCAGKVPRRVTKLKTGIAELRWT